MYLNNIFNSFNNHADLFIGLNKSQIVVPHPFWTTETWMSPKTWVGFRIFYDYNKLWPKCASILHLFLCLRRVKSLKIKVLSTFVFYAKLRVHAQNWHYQNRVLLKTFCNLINLNHKLRFCYFSVGNVSRFHEIKPIYRFIKERKIALTSRKDNVAFNFIIIQNAGGNTVTWHKS